MTAAAAPSDQDPARRRAARLVGVRRLKTALPVAAIGLLALCLIQVTARGPLGEPATAPPSDERRMLGPRFSGKTGDGRAFVITGREATSQDVSDARIVIAEPVFRLSARTGATSTATARSGVYREAARELVLTGGVKLDNGLGTTFTTPEAVVDTRSGRITSRTGLRVKGAAGQMQAGAFEADDEGGRVVLKGGVRARLNPDR
jgi:lipopolysaccharide export system protein LptC